MPNDARCRHTLAGQERIAQQIARYEAGREERELERAERVARREEWERREEYRRNRPIYATEAEARAAAQY